MQSKSKADQKSISSEYFNNINQSRTFHEQFTNKGNDEQLKGLTEATQRLHTQLSR